MTHMHRQGGVPHRSPPCWRIGVSSDVLTDVLGPSQKSQFWRGRDAFGSRLSFPATGPPDPGRVSERLQKGSQNGVSEGSLKGFLKPFRRVLEGVKSP